jgi:[acyl-carrier-protein] S-malonyltransferase
MVRNFSYRGVVLLRRETSDDRLVVPRMPNELQQHIGSTAFAFRGYNVTNLGRTPELLAHPAFGPTVRRHLEQASAVCAAEIGRPVDLVRVVEDRIEPGLDRYAEAVALIMAAELAQIALLERHFGVLFSEARLTFGYSLGELTAIICSGMYSAEGVMRVPIALAEDSAALAENAHMGILFSRGPVIEELAVRRLCQQITAEGNGTIGCSAVLSPNTYLLLGQHDTIGRFSVMMHDVLPKSAHLRVNPDRWPPLHTEIVRQRFIPDRASLLMEGMRGSYVPPCPPIVSLVTGKRSYDDVHARDILRRWCDHPQRLWDAVYDTLASGVTTVVHVGPEPNVAPATFTRLAENVQQQISGSSWGSYGLRAAKGLARRPWLASILPSRAALLRAADLKQIILEDWLLENGKNLHDPIPE